MAQPSADPLSQDSNLSELRRSVPPRVGPPPHTPVRPPPARRPPSARCLRLCTSHALLGPYAVTTIDWIGFPFSRAGPKGNPTAYDERTIENRAPSKAKRHLPIQEHCARACHAYPYARLAHISAAPPLRPPATIPPWLCARSRTRRVIMFLLWPQSRAGHPTCSSTRSQGQCDFQPPDTPPTALGAALHGAALGAAGRTHDPHARPARTTARTTTRTTSPRACREDVTTCRPSLIRW
jgi:hypothetical protein